MKCEEDLALTRRFCVNSIKHHESASHAAKHEFFNTIGQEQTCRLERVTRLSKR